MKIFGLLRQRQMRRELYSRADYWNSKAENLTGGQVSMWRNPHLNALYDVETFETIDRLLGPLKGLACLEIGCGTGRICRFLSSKGAQVTGIDFAEKALDRARSHPCSVSIEYRHLSVFDLDENEKYDVVISWGSVVMACCDRSELQTVLKKTRTALRVGGVLLLLEPIHAGFLHRVLKMSLADFTDSLKDAGFRVDRIQALHFWPCRLLLAYIVAPRWMTNCLYAFGQEVMKCSSNISLGDYKALLASRQENKQ
jgi:2-polyprenyl-3-methyl-5-hydroxy-6-metoxy-1,4-benzoquinol methylase